MEFGSFGGGDDGEYNDVGFVLMSMIFAMQENFFFGTGPVEVYQILFDRVVSCSLSEYAWGMCKGLSKETGCLSS